MSPLRDRILDWWHGVQRVDEATLRRLQAEADAKAILPPVGTKDWPQPKPAQSAEARTHRAYVEEVAR